MKKIIVLLLTMLFMQLFLSCNDRKKEKKQLNIAVPYYDKLLNNDKERTRLWKAAIDSGDFNAYNKLAVPYLLKDRSLELYYYSLIMANKYHCPEAYDVLNAILEHEVSTGDMVLLSNDKDTKNMALYYLFRAKELGFEHAQSEVERRFGKGKSVPNSSFFLKQLMKP